MRRPRRVRRPSSSRAPRAYLQDDQLVRRLLFHTLSTVAGLIINVQLFHRNNERVNGRWVHEIKMHDIVNAHRFQRQHNIAEVRSLNLGNGGGKHLVFERVFGV
jgi:hypothetical protein